MTLRNAGSCVDRGTFVRYLHCLVMSGTVTHREAREREQRLDCSARSGCRATHTQAITVGVLVALPADYSFWNVH